MTAEGIERARALLAEVLRLDVATLPADAEQSAVSAWDSLAHVRIVLRIESELARRLEPEEVLSLQSLSAIADLLERD